MHVFFMEAPMRTQSIPTMPPLPWQRCSRASMLLPQNRQRCWRTGELLRRRLPRLPAEDRRRLTGSTAHPGSSDRFELFMLRGEAYFENGPSSTAAEAFDSASHVVPPQENLLTPHAPAPRQCLVRTSPALKYTPSGGFAGPIDIIIPESRTKAMQALSKD